jgi:hypothetical protein
MRGIEENPHRSHRLAEILERRVEIVGHGEHSFRAAGHAVRTGLGFRGSNQARDGMSVAGDHHFTSFIDQLRELSARLASSTAYVMRPGD